MRSDVTHIAPSRAWAGIALSPVWHSRELFAFLCWRSIKVRYKQAAIGVGWVVLQPLLTMLVFTVIFGKLAQLPSDNVPYPVFAFSALVPWTFFSQALSRGGTSLVTDASLLTKVYFPRVLIPLASCTTPLVDFVLSLVILLGLMAWYGIAPTWHVVFAPVFVLLLWLTALACSLWFAPLNVRYRDVGHALPFVTQIWMYGSPVLYSAAMIPERWRTLYSLNPVGGALEGFRWALLGTAPPSPGTVATSAALVLIALAAGSVYFRRQERNFADIV
ncbi:MAG TPA: ABC transporter permease [Gemmatimonadaceae bacterium]|nr:ABC transporter permease [Gemmatimonadaceae bacterium]